MFTSNSRSWVRILRDMDNFQIFDLCREFEELSLDENTPSTSNQPESSNGIVEPGNRGYLLRCLHRWTNSLWGRSINEQLRAPFIELPRPFLDLDSSSSSSFVESYNNIHMGFGYRFLPGQEEFLLQELQIPESFDRISFLSSSLGLLYYKSLPTYDSLLPYGCSGAGLRGLVIANLSKILVEVITHYDGMYGRFLINVCLGVGCTVRYAFVPGRVDQAPVGGPFAPFNSYRPFLDMSHYERGFRRIGFVETTDVSASVMSAFENENPFAEITIPTSGPALRSVGLGLMISFFLSVGIVPGSGNRERI